jgi:nucleotide-binding universal stress UspA family protein
MYRRIALALDGSPMAEQAIPHAIAQAQRFEAELVLLRAVEPFPHVSGLSQAELAKVRRHTNDWAFEYLDNLACDIRQHGVSVGTAVVEAQPSAGILQYVESNAVDLIVICTRGRSGFSRWLMGSVADRVVRGATVPVLLVRAKAQ